MTQETATPHADLMGERREREREGEGERERERERRSCYDGKSNKKLILSLLKQLNNGIVKSIDTVLTALSFIFFPSINISVNKTVACWI